MDRRRRIALVVSHPIQHFCPQYVSFAQNNEVTFKVFFGSALGFKKYLDPSFGREIVWDNLGLEYFSHIFLNGDAVLATGEELDASNIGEELSKFSPDIVITYGYFQKMQRRAQKWAVTNGVKVAYISDSERRRRRPLLIELFKKIYVKMHFRNIDYFLTVGDANEDYYKYYGVTDRQLIRMPFPIDKDCFEKVYQDKGTNRKWVRDKYHIKEEDIVLGVVGKIEKFKRQLDIVKAIGTLRYLNRKSFLLVIGAGPNEQSIKEYVESSNIDGIIFTGFIPPQQLASYYAAIDIYIHPSESDAHSLAISEAIYMGCPIIVSDRCGSYGTSDDVQEGKNGFIYETGSIQELSKYILTLIINDKLRKEFSDFSRQLALMNQQTAHYLGLKALIEIIKHQSD